MCLRTCCNWKFYSSSLHRNLYISRCSWKLINLRELNDVHWREGRCFKRVFQRAIIMVHTYAILLKKPLTLNWTLLLLPLLFYFYGLMLILVWPIWSKHAQPQFSRSLPNERYCDRNWQLCVNFEPWRNFLACRQPNFQILPSTLIKDFTNQRNSQSRFSLDIINIIIASQSKD